MENWNLHTLLVGSYTDVVTLETVWQMVPQRIKNITQQFHSQVYISKGNKNIRPHKHLYMNAHCGIIHNSPKVEAIQMSTN